MLHTLAAAPRAPSLKPFLEYVELESRNLKDECPSAVAPDGALLEYETLELRVHPPNVEIDNEGDEGATIVTVDSVNRPGTLVQLVQCLTGLGLRISQARISSDRGWFVDDFHVTDADGGKVTDERKLSAIRKVLTVERAPLAEADSAVLELAGEDCPGLLADVHMLLAQSGFDVQSAAVWTHKQKVGFAMSVSQAGKPVDYAKLETVRQVLLTMLGGHGQGVALVHRVRGSVHLERKLHVLLLEEERKRLCLSQGCSGVYKPAPPSPRPVPGMGMRLPHRSPKHSYPEVTIKAMPRLGYWLVKVVCGDRDKLLFDIACTLADMDYDVYHGSVDCGSDGRTAYLEFYIRPRFQEVEWDEARVEILKYLLETAIQRRFPRGLKVHVQPQASQGSLGAFMQAVKEGDLCVTRAKVRRQVPGRAPGHTFYLLAADGSMPCPSQVQAACCRLGGELVLERGVDGGSSDESVGGAHREERNFCYSFQERQRSQEWEDNSSSSTASTASISL
ncbi:unnamed protein product [Ostreobium quekettii]|uniref:ACT domain-containing protein n=1 Tax=Ostreobium quekettii TaxID=121088 RepID=A0A8S1JCL3_9CHLO|nr:unnamed protein product [Ostreobium quekettii]